MSSETSESSAGDPRLYSTGDVAHAYGVHTSTVRRWVSLGWLAPTATTAGGHRRYTRTAVLAVREHLDAASSKVAS